MFCERHQREMPEVCGEPICGACFGEALEIAEYRPAKERTPEQVAFLTAYYVTGLFHGDRDQFVAAGFHV